MEGGAGRAVALVCGALAACTPGADDGLARFSTVDSAGIPVGHSRSPRWGRVVVSERAFELGRASGPDHLLFDRISGVTRLDDGAIAVGNRGTNTVRIFEESGRLLDELGGTGDGPGELTLLREVMRCRAGAITVFDYDWRMLRFDRGGEYLGSSRIDFPGDRFGVYEMSCDARGRIVGTGWGDGGLRGHPVGNYRSVGGLYAGESAAGPFVRLGTTVIADRYALANGDEGPHPFGRTTVLGAFQEGFVRGTADDYAVTVHALDGDTTLLVRWDGPHRALRDEHVEAYLEGRLAEADERDWPTVRREVAELEMPDSLPAYDAVEVGPEGVIWIREFAAPWLEGPRWWGFLPDGEWAWELELEPDFEVTEFGADEVLGVATDDLGIETVRGYRLVLPRDSTQH